MDLSILESEDFDENKRLICLNCGKGLKNAKEGDPCSFCIGVIIENPPFGQVEKQ